MARAERLEGVTRREALALPLAALAGGPAGFGGTFLQFWAAHREWSGARWERLLGYLEELGARELVAQWSAYDGIEYGETVERLMDRAAERRMKVRVGLRHASGWWGEAGARPETALAGIERRAAEADEGWRKRVRRHKAFGGWYLPEEMVEEHWLGPERERALAGCLKRVRERFRPLAVSGFTNRARAAAETGAWWRRMVKGSGVEEVLFQDGIGAGKTTLENLPEYAAALRAGVGGKLRIVVETFAAAGGGGAFQAVPAPVERVIEQCRVAVRWSRRAPLAFSLPEYCTPEGGEAAARWYREYLQRAE